MNLDELSKKEFIGSGCCGRCYKLENGTVYKEFNDPESTNEIYRFKKFLNYSNDSFMFPFDFVCGKTKYYGHISKYALGKPFIDSVKSADILKMCKDIIKLENDIKYVSEGKIIMFDFHNENLLYDGSKFSVIDVDEYVSSSVYTFNEVYERNKKALKNTLVSAFQTYVGKHLFYQMQKYIYSDTSANELLYLIKEYLEYYYKINVNSLDNIRRRR